MPGTAMQAFDARTRLGAALAAWGIAALVLWLGAVTLCRTSGCDVPALDRQWLQTLHELRRPWLDGLMKSVTWLGSLLLLAPAALLLAWHRARGGHRLPALQLLAALGGAWLLAHAAKLLVARPRPDLYQPLIEMPADLAFPSAHSLQITAFVLAWLFTAPGRPRLAAVTIAVLAVVLVSLSRLYLQVHFPTDVLAGLVAGAAWAAGLRLALGGRP